MKLKHIIVLSIVYLAFIALGLPDALLGSSWNMVREDLSMPLGAIGFVTFFSYILTMVATYNAPRVLSLFQTKQIVFISVITTGTALILMSQASAFYLIVLLAIPLGLGAGAIDLSLNHYVAVHFKASHMNYLHSFYGLGVTFGPLIMSYTLRDDSWRLGYIIVGSVLLFIALCILVSFRFWDKETVEHREEHHSNTSLKQILTQKGVKHSLAIFLIYVHIESLLGVFIASYIFISKDVSYATAALFTMTYFLALTIGRILSGVLSDRLHPNGLIIIGELLMLLGGILLFFDDQSTLYYFICVGLIGVGSGPVFPNMMHMNPYNFKQSMMSKIMSIQMVFGYLGFGILTPLMGQLFQYTTIELYPIIVIALTILLLLITYQFLRFNLHHKQKEVA